MQKLSNNQKGFSIGQVLLVVVVLGIIGGIGYYVYSRQSSTPTAEPTSTTVTPAADTTDENKTATADWKTYSGMTISMKYPETWKPRDITNEPDRVYFASADYVAPGEDGPSVTAGYLLDVMVSNTPSDDSHEAMVAGYKETKDAGACGGDYQEITIDGEKAVLSDMKCHGSDITAIAIKDGTEYFFRLSSIDEDKPEVRTLFNHILSTVTLP
ncbi:hypothetical protein KA047_02255 [Candidatus Saccharibacteria bacterium]|nr:hypothetical protein [Candidatus Saccharibacteria bacterium]